MRDEDASDEQGAFDRAGLEDGQILSSVVNGEGPGVFCTLCRQTSWLGFRCPRWPDARHAGVTMIAAGVIRGAIRKAVILSMRRVPRGAHITRYYMYRHLSEVLRRERTSGRMLSISGSLNLCALFDVRDSQITEVNYPDFNVLHLPFVDGEFDHVVSDQVLEHVEGDPQRAIDETWRVIQPGGLAVHTTCFVNPLHREPGDFWRFSPDALKFLCRKFSRIVDVGGWGNPYVWLVASLGLRNEGVPEARWHPLHKLAMLNDERWPIVTWIVAQK